LNCGENVTKKYGDLRRGKRYIVGEQMIMEIGKENVYFLVC
jgi:hypothetical protein